MYMWDVWAYILLDCTEEETFFGMLMFSILLLIYRKETG